jgi:hypothetical protein
MNLQLVLARAAAESADRRWRQHRPECPKCSSAQRARAPGMMCGAGRKLYDDMKACQADLVRERELDKLPLPGQQALFTIQELDGDTR